ncbi:MAG: hypothetical protein ACLR8L_00730 [Oscillospiraceae bacterium]
MKGAFRCASGGPFFSVLPEKNGKKRGAGYGLVRPAGGQSRPPLRRCIKNSELHQALREKSRKTKGVFLVGSRGAGGKSKSPRTRFLFPIFSFGEAKENAGQQLLIFNTSSYFAVRLKMLRLFVYSTPVTS